MSKEAKLIEVAKDFSKYPSGRYYADSRYSGQRFREELLERALRANPEVRVNLDGTLGYGSSFLDEAFGGLIRVSGFTSEFLRKHLKLLSKDKGLVEEAWSYIQ